MRRSMSSRGHGGPLMTDHLQLQDLDLELELLKRKREMIEKQQQQIMGNNQPFNRPRPFDYGNQPQQPFQGLQQPYNAPPLFSRYNEPQQPNGYGGGGGLLGKRPMNDQPWQNHSTPKRFSGPPSGPKKKFNSGPSPKINMPRPEPFVQRPQALMNNRAFSHPRPQWNKPQPMKGPKSNFPSQRFNNPKIAKPIQKDFKPTKVAKPRPAAPANKLASLPVPERAKLVKQAIQGSKEEVDQNFILRDDQVPSQQLAGRLELALGHILKEIKTKYGNSEPHTVSFQSVFAQRQMKQAIRERLRSVMMGKYVGKAVAIVETYRKVFPVETDTEIVQIALDAQQSQEVRKLAIKLESADSAYKFIKLNLNRLVGVTLDEMFQKLQKIYSDDTESTKDICSKILVEAATLNTEEESQQTESDDKNESNANTNDESKNEVHEASDAENQLNANEAEAHNVSGQSVDAATTGQNEDEKTGDVEIEDQTGNDVPALKDDEAAAKLDSLVLSLLRRRLSSILPRYRNMLLKVLNVSGSYRVTKDAILEKASEKQRIDRRVEQAEKGETGNDVNSSINGDSTINANPSTPTRPMSPYMVKILGRPVLPKRKLMQDFLNDYKPSSVKKHRSMHLLFVAFDNKEDFDKIVAVKETTIGTSTIFIKVNEKVGAKPNDSLNAATTLNESTDSAALPSDLDEQINDLLSSIRKEEEDKDDIKAEPAAENGDAEKLEVDSNEKVTTPKVNGNVKTEVQVDDASKEEKVESEVTEEAKNDAAANLKELKTEAKDKVEELKNDGKESGRATPTRASSRLANVTPSSVRTRRASRLVNN